VTQPTGSTRHDIVAAAVQLISERGFSATSVEEIAAAAGVAKGSVFYNFGSKAELFAAILTDGITRLTVALRGALAAEPHRPQLEVLVTELLRQVHDNPAFAKVIAAEVFRTGRDWQASIGLIHDEAMAVFRDAALADDPTLAPHDAEVAGSAVFGATLVAGLEWLAFQPERTLEDVLPALLRALARVRPS
jgi:AcrR family transcriptional regulator